jgi:hypothetical protein
MWNGLEKRAMRHFALEKTGKNPAKHYLCLPSDTLLDIKEGLETGVIDKNTLIIAVEKDMGKIPAIKKQLSKIFPDYYLFPNQFYRLDLSDCGDIDFANIDLCGQLDKKIAKWLLKMDKFTDGAKVCFTFSLGRQINELMYHERELPRYDHILSVISKCTHCMGGFTGLNDNSIKCLYYLFGILSHNYIFHFERICEYRDRKTPMLYVQLRIDRRAVNHLNAITRHVVDLCKDLGVKIFTPFLPKPGRNPKERLEMSVEIQKPHQIIKCPTKMTPGQKMVHVKNAKKGIRPPWMKPANWAWNEMNPNGMRKNRVA